MERHLADIDRETVLIDCPLQVEAIHTARCLRIGVIYMRPISHFSAVHITEAGAGCRGVSIFVFTIGFLQPDAAHHQLCDLFLRPCMQRIVFFLREFINISAAAVPMIILICLICVICNGIIPVAGIVIVLGTSQRIPCVSVLRHPDLTGLRKIIRRVIGVSADHHIDAVWMVGIIRNGVFIIIDDITAEIAQRRWRCSNILICRSRIARKGSHSIQAIGAKAAAVCILRTDAEIIRDLIRHSGYQLDITGKRILRIDCRVGGALYSNLFIICGPR